jgi:hypothetical protein
MIVFSANFFQPFFSKMIDTMPLSKVHYLLNCSTHLIQILYTDTLYDYAGQVRIWYGPMIFPLCNFGLDACILCVSAQV